LLYLSSYQLLRLWLGAVPTWSGAKWLFLAQKLPVSLPHTITSRKVCPVVEVFPPSNPAFWSLVGVHKPEPNWSSSLDERPRPFSLPLLPSAVPLSPPSFFREARPPKLSRSLFCSDPLRRCVRPPYLDDHHCGNTFLSTPLSSLDQAASGPPPFSPPLIKHFP